MINYILDYLGEHGVAAGSAEEEARIEDGIKLYLKENGIDNSETRPYFRKFVNRHLDRIPAVELLEYFSFYTTMSEIRQIVIEYDNSKTISNADRSRLYQLMTELQAAGFGDKYVPKDMIKEILGAYS